MRGFRAVIYKETIHILRDSRTLLLMVIMPALEIIFFAYAINFDVRNVATAIYDLDGRAESRRVLERFRNTGSMNIVHVAHSDEELTRMLVDGRARVGIKFPPDFTDKARMGQDAAFQFLVDGSNSTVALHALSVAETIALTESVKILSRAVGEQISATEGLPMESRSRVLFNPDMRTRNFLIPGFVASLLHPMIIIFTAMAIVREKEEGTLEQLMVTPISRWGLMLGKLMPYTEIAAVELLLCFLVVRYLFNIPFAGNPLVLAVGSLGFVLTALSLGLLLSTIATNQLQAIQFSFLVSFPCDILSGFVFPQEGMPPFIYWIAQISPLSYYMRVIRGVIVRGAGFEDLWGQCAVLFAMGGVLIIISALRFKKTVG